MSDTVKDVKNFLLRHIFGISAT